MKKIALLGAAHIHTPDFVRRLLARNDLKVVGVWDHDNERANLNAQKLGCPTCSSVDEMLKFEALDAVIVCSETNRHEAIIQMVAEAGKHCFVEKPLGMGKADSERMEKALTEAGVLFQTGYFSRSKSAFRKIKELIDTNSFGTISRIRLNNYHAKNLKEGFEGWMWMTNMEQAGVGAFGDLGTHVLDILLWFMNDLEAVTASFSSPVARYPNCDESGEALLRFKSGVVASIAAGWVDLAMPMIAEVSGTKAYAHVAPAKVRSTYDSYTEELYLKSEEIENANGIQPFTDMPENLPHAFELFLDAIQSGEKTNLVSAKEAAYRSTVMEAIYEAAATRKWVNVEPYN